MTRVYTAFTLLFIVATRWACAPKYLYYFDSANFAFSLEEFNPSLHQPQPPGYALYVGLLRLIHLFVANPATVQLIAGLIAACGAAVLIRMLGAELFGPAAGILSMVLLASDPIFWFGGVTNQIRVFLALSSVGVALLAWRALARPQSAGRLCAAFAALGIAAGFRPVLAVLLLPLLFWVWFRTGHSLRRLIIGALCLVATALPWVAVTLAVVGGPGAMVRMMWDYSEQQFSGSSALYGAETVSAWKMFAGAVVWTGVGALAWIWALPFCRAGFSLRRTSVRPILAFSAFWFLPPFLFSAFVHVGDPDQALASVPVVTLAGGAVLSALAQKNERRLLALSAVVVALHTLMFFKPPSKLAKAGSYKAVAMVDALVSGPIDAIHRLRADGPLTIVSYGSVVTYRQLAYYFPEDYVLLLPGAPGRPGSEPPAEYFRHENLPIPAGKDGLRRPGSRRTICLLPPNAPKSSLPGWRTAGPVYYLDSPEGQNLTIGPYDLEQKP